MAGLHLALRPGWKTYWRAPGEAGIPPRFNWEGSVNLKSVEVQFPTPLVFHSNGMQSIGYHDDVVFPLLVTALDPLLPVHLEGAIDLGVCEDICVPARVRVSGDLAGAGASDARIAAAVDTLPVAEGAASCEAEAISDGLRLTARIAGAGSAQAVVIEAAEPDVWVSQTTVSQDAGGLVAMADLVPPTGAPFDLDRSGVVITVLGSARAVQIAGCSAP